MIGTDRNLFAENSEARRRIIEYGRLVDELHIIVFAKKGFANQNFGNVFLYPTDALWKPLYFWNARKIAKKILVAGGQWLVTSQDPFETGLVGYCLKRKFQIPWQIQIHTDFLSPYFKKESPLNRFRVCLARFLLSRADCARVVSERIKNSLSFPKSSPNSKFQIPDSKIAVLPIFVDAEEIRNAPIKTDLRRKYPQFDFIILMLSRLSREKNIALAIDAFAAAAEKYPRTGLVIVGDGQERKNCAARIAAGGLKNNVILENRTDDAASYFKTADLFLLTSNYEGYGRTVIEARAAGCPVVMTDVGVAGEIIRDGENGLVVPVGDRAKLEEAMIKVIGDKKLRDGLAAKAGGALGNRPTKEEYLQEYLRLWRECRKK